MQVGNAFVGIHHRQIGILRIRFGNRFFHARAGGGIQFIQIGQQVAEAVIHVHAGGRQLFAVLLEHGGEKHFHGVPENNRVGHFHHGRLHVQREQHALLFRVFHLLLQELHQGFFAQHGGIDDFACFQRQRFAQFGGFAGFVGVDDSDGGRLGHGNGLFVMEKIAALHGGDVRFAVRRPCAHAVRIFFGKIFHGFRSAAVGVAFAQHGVYRAAFDAVVTRLDFAFFVILRISGISGDGKAFGLQFGNGGVQLRHGRADVGQLDNVGFGLRNQFAQLRQGICNALVFLQIFGKRGQNAAGQ